MAPRFLNLLAETNTTAGGILAGLRLLTPRERVIGLFLAGSTVVNAVLQTIAVVAVVPLIQAMIDPGASLSTKLLGIVQAVFGENDRLTALLYFAYSILALIALRTIFGWLQAGWLARFSASCEARLSSELMLRSLLAPYSWLLTQTTGRLRQIIFDNVVVWSRDLIRSLIRLGNDLFFAAILVGVLVWVNPLMGAIVLVASAGLACLIFLVIRPILLRLGATKRDHGYGASNITQDALAGIKDVKMANAETLFGKLFSERLIAYSMTDAKGQQWIQLPRLITEAIAYGSLIAISIFIITTQQNVSEIGGLLVLYGVSILRLLPTLNAIVTAFGSIVTTFPQVRDIERLLTETTNAPRDAVQSPPFGHWHRLNLAQVSYVYVGGERPAIADVSLSVVRGRSYGIVGPSGSGKSTLIDVVAGLLSPASGKLIVDGTELSDEKRFSWRRQFGYVAQRPFLFSGSIRNNIAFGSASDESRGRIMEVVREARLEGVVSQLAKGLDSDVGERGSSLSGGQQQRIAIARALYRGADILILDEATSALDSITEREIANSIDELKGVATTLVVSHRLGLVRHCDEIWVLDGGSVIARGSHDELLQSCALYRRMVEAMEGGNGPEAQLAFQQAGVTAAAE